MLLDGIEKLEPRKRALYRAIATNDIDKDLAPLEIHRIVRYSAFCSTSTSAEVAVSIGARALTDGRSLVLLRMNALSARSISFVS